METLTDITGSQEKVDYHVAKNIMSQMKCAMPAIIESIDFTNQTLTAKPVTKMKKVSNHGVVSDFDMPLIVDVPFQCYKGGNYYITVPIAVGDECLIIFTDVDFSAWWQNGGFQYAEHRFLHSYSNAIAIIGLNSEVNSIPNYSSTAVEIRNLDRSQYISMSTGNITLKSGTITLDGNVITTGTSNLQGTTTIQNRVFLEHTHGNGNQGDDTTGVN